MVPKGDHFQLSPKGVRRIGQLALRDIYQSLLKDRAGGHVTDHRGITEMRPEQTKPYAFGDPLNLNLVGDAEACAGAQGRRAAGAASRKISRSTKTTTRSSSSTVLCLDMSWSMSWEGRFAAAKKVAMAMETLIRSKFPRDFFSIVGFFTRAVELKLKDLPEASWNMGDPFTNLQDGLRLASDLLGRHPSRNQHIIVITDGQPTAYFLNKRLYCEWPLSFGGISMRAAQETLKEVERDHAQGNHDQHLHARRFAEPARLRREDDADQSRPRAVHASRPSRRIHAGRLPLQETQACLNQAKWQRLRSRWSLVRRPSLL